MPILLKGIMTTLLYCNISEMMDHEIQDYMNLLPEFIRKDIIRHRFAADQKCALIARLMIHQVLKEEGLLNLIHEWQRDKNNKPFIKNWYSFNISHSGEVVIFGYGPGAGIGVDIEKNGLLDYIELAEYFHPAERKFILESANIQKAFYEIWVKKEAFLKALGFGIVQGLREFNCVKENINHYGMDWYMHKLELNPEYTAYLCSSNNENNILIRQLHLESLTN